MGRAPTPLPAAGAVPQLCLPVRLETRFYKGDPPKIRIRFYPDRLHIDDHDPRLSASEAALAKHHAAAFAKTTPDAAKLDAWRALVAQLGTPRATYLVDRILAKKTEAKRADDQNRTAMARLLPRLWVVRGYAGGAKVFEAQSGPVSRELVASPEAAFLDEEGIATDSPLAWMAHFDRAVAAGMALERNLPPDAQDGFDRLIAVGLPRGALNAADLESQFTRQMFSVGAGFVPQGTATNNTETARSGWSKDGETAAESFSRAFPELLRSPPEAPPQDGTLAATTGGPAKLSNRERFADTLGIADLSRLPHAEGREDALQRHMNLALWPATWGTYVQELLKSKGAPPFSGRDIAWVRDLFVSHMRGGAACPAFRVGNTPYGLALSAPGTKGGNARREALEGLLTTLKPQWLDAGRGVPVLSDGAAAGGPEDILGGLLSRVPHPRAFTARELRDREFQLNFYYEIYRHALWEQSPYVDLVASRFNIRIGGSQGRAAHADNIERQRSDIFWIYQMIRQHDLRYGPGVIVNPNASGAAARRLSNGTYLDLNRPNASDRDRLLNSGAETMTDAESFDLFKAIAETMIYCEKLFEHIEEHEARNRVFGQAGASASVYKGTIGTGHEDPKIAFALYGDAAVPWPDAYLVQTGDEVEPGVPPSVYLPYLAGVARSYVTDAAAPAPVFAGDAKRPLLYHLCAHALDRLRRDLIDAGLTPGTAMARPRRQGNGRNAFAIAPLGTSGRARLAMYQAADSFSALAALGPESLRLLLRQTLDLCGWRLDALWQALLWRELEALRKTNPNALRIGAYGVVENLRPSWNSRDLKRSESFVHTPSLQHAKTAAILRAGRHARQAKAASDPLSIDLSSARMKKAVWCFDAVREGADLGDVLGAMAERALTDIGRGDLIDPLRRAIAAETGEPEDPANPTVDGMDLLAAWDNGNGQRDLVQALRYRGGAKPARPGRVAKAAEAIADVADAMADLSLAEATFDLVRGDPGRAGTGLSAIADGSAPVPDFQILRTPDDGAVITNQVMLSAPNTGAPAWPGNGSARAAADPAGEKMASHWLGPAAALEVRLLGAGRSRASLADLLKALGGGIGALDVLSMAVPGKGRSALERHLDRGAKAWSGMPDARIDPEDPSGTLRRIEVWRRTLFASRPVEVEDFLSLHVPQPENSANTAGSKMKGLYTQAETAVADFEAALQALGTAVQLAETKAAFGGLAAALRALKPYDAWHLAEAEAARADALIASARETLNKLGRRAEAARALMEGADPDGVTAGFARAVLKEVFGAGMLVPRAMPKTIRGQVAKSLLNSAERLANLPRAPLGWLADIGRVRPHLRDLSELLMLEQALDRSDLEAAVAQFPEPGGVEPWVAQAAPKDGRAAGAALIVAAAGNGTVADVFAKSGMAVVVDTVIERIPPRARDTALALELETPNAEAPQVMALLVPQKGRPLTTDEQFAALQELLDWSVCRAVDGGDLPAFDQHLPAVFPGGALWTAAEAHYGAGGAP